jgi:enoyl-CoA hydratase/carnithine racemase
MQTSLGLSLEQIYQMAGVKPGIVSVDSSSALQRISFSRVNVINALDPIVVQKITDAIQEGLLPASETTHFLIEAAEIPGKAIFSVGGDVVGLARVQKFLPRAQALKFQRHFLNLEYGLNHLIATSAKPVIVIMDGITCIFLRVFVLFIVIVVSWWRCWNWHACRVPNSE